MELIIDRFEGDFAVGETEDKIMINLLVSELPLGAKVGDVLNITNDRTCSINTKETNRRKERIKKKMDSLWE